MTFRAMLHLVCCAGLLLAASSTALAANADADAAFARGTRAYQQGDNRGAALAFEEAYRLSPHGVAKYSAALAWEADKDPARAADDFRTALDSSQLDARQQADAEKRLQRLERGLGRIQITAPPGTTIRVAHIDGASAPVNLHVAPGQHQIVARFADGRESSTTVRVGAGETFDAALSVPSAPRAASTPKPESAPPERDKASSSAQKTWGFVALGGGVVASAAAIYLGTRALAARDDFSASGFHDQDAHDRAASLRTATNVTWGVAGVLGATGVILILTAPSHSKERVSLVVGPASAACAGRF